MANKLCQALASYRGVSLDDELQAVPLPPKEGVLGLRPIDLLNISEPCISSLLDQLDLEPRAVQVAHPWPDGGLFEDELWAPLALSTCGHLLSMGLSPSELYGWLEGLRSTAEVLLQRNVDWRWPDAADVPLVNVPSGMWECVPAEWLFSPGELMELPPGIGTVADLGGITESTLISGVESVPEFLAQLGVIAYLAARLEKLESMSSVAPAKSSECDISYAEYVRFVLAEGVSKADDSIWVEALLLRSGLISGEELTLQEIAERAGVTRERIRQVEARAVERANLHLIMNLLSPLRLAIGRIVRKHGGSCDRDVAAAEALSLFGWDDANIIGAGALMSCLPEVRSVDGNQLLLRELPCDRCAALEAGLLSAMTDEHAARLDEASGSVRGECTALDALCPWLAGMSTERLVGLLDDAQVGGRMYRIRDGWVLDSEHDGRGVTTKSGQILRVLRTAARAMHAGEVYDQLCQEAGDVGWTKRNVYATLERSPDAVSWDTGSFIHVERMPFPYSLLREIEDWLAERLEGVDGLPMMSVAAAATTFHARLLEAGVDAELALYSLLRISADPRLVYPRYAKVYLASEFDGRIPLTTAIEEYVRDAGEPVQLTELRSYICDAMGFKDFQFQIALADTPGLLRYDRHKVIHYDLTAVDPAAKMRILDRARTLLEAEGSIAARRLYEATEVDCVLNHIATPQLLHSLVGRWGESGVAAGRYPTIYTGEDQEHDELTEMVVEYLRTKAAPCAMQELEEVFVETRGYRTGTVWAVGQRDEIYRYLRGGVVHSDAIGWDAGKQAALEMAASDLLSARHAAGAFYAKVTDLIESPALPALKGQIVWTEQLLSDLLGRSGRFHVLGNARNAFVAADNSERMASFGDLVALIVEREFGGGAGLDSLERWLLHEKLILKSLTAGMLQDTERLEIRGLEVSVARLMQDA